MTSLATNGRPVRIGINAVLLTRGGATVALEKLLSEFDRLRPDFEYHIAADPTLLGLASLQKGSIHGHPRRFASCGRGAFAAWHLVGLPIWLLRNQIDILFNYTCYLPPLMPRRTVLLMQDARFFSEDIEGLNGARFRERAAFA